MSPIYLLTFWMQVIAETLNRIAETLVHVGLILRIVAKSVNEHINAVETDIFANEMM